MDRALPGGRRAHPDPRIFDLSGSAEHAAGGPRAGIGRDADDALFTVRTRRRSRARTTGRGSFLRDPADRLTGGPVRTGGPHRTRGCGVRRPLGRTLERSITSPISRPATSPGRLMLGRLTID